MASLRRRAVVWCCLAGMACGPGAPTGPTGVPTAVSPFIDTWPAPFTGSDVPDFVGVWTGAMRLTDCRAAPPSVCKVAPGPRDIRLVVGQQGSGLTGVFSMNEPSVTGWTFTGYVTSSRGIAGAAELGGESRVLVRLIPDGQGFSGEVADEVRTAGRLTFTRHFVVSTPLRRVGPTL